MMWSSLGHMNAMPKRADRLRLYYNIFLKFEGSMRTYLRAREED